MEEHEIRTKISQLKTYWGQRNIRFREWYEVLVLIDQFAARGLESYTSNEPQTFYDMAHFLLTRGELSHSIPIEGEAAMEYDRRAKVDRACRYAWSRIDKERMRGGNPSYRDELGFYLLTLGWYSTVFHFDQSTGLLTAQLWNPYDTYPQYASNVMPYCVHSYKISEEEAGLKASANGWFYEPRNPNGMVNLDDFWRLVDGIYYNIILINDKPVTGWVPRPEMTLAVAPVAGFPDRGSLTPNRTDWKRLIGRSIFEADKGVFQSFNKWKTMISQILRDTAQPITQEFSATQQATPEQLRERGAHFHYSPGDQGIVRVPPAAIPIEIQAHLMEIRREIQKGSFNDAVYGMMEGQAGYALDKMADASANQILYPYMDAKHFVYSTGDEFWLSKLKGSRRVFEVKGKFIEKLKPTDIPEDVTVIVESEVATPKDWLERSTIANQLEKHLDRNTILGEILKQGDPQAIIRRKSIDRMLDHPVSQLVEMIAGYYVHADYLELRGDHRQAELFRRAAQALEMQLGAPAPGQGAAPEMGRVQAEREAGAPAARPTVSPNVMPPEARGGFTPAELRDMVGQGRLRR